MAIEWYVKNDDKQVGPISSAQLKELAVRQRITPQTQVRRSDRPEWVAAGAIKDLFETQPTLPRAPQPPVIAARPSAPSPKKSARGLFRPVIVGGGIASAAAIVAIGSWAFRGGSAPNQEASAAAAPGHTEAAKAEPAPKAVAPDVNAPDKPPQETQLPPPRDNPLTAKLSVAYRKALLLSEHGLDDLAKAELIEIVMGKAPPLEKAKAYYLLGSIAFSEKRIGSALETWRELVATYPESPEARDVKDRIAQLAEMAGENAKESTNNAVAESYLRNAEFWSSGRDKIFGIDSSWIPHVESAVKWYDKVIAEYPGTTASRVAHESKLFTILGWKDRRYDAIRHGLEADFEKYMPVLQEALAAFEKEHPNASAIQAFRFQVAQAYWGKNDFENTKLWLEKIVAAAGPADSFYGHLAAERLARLKP